MLNIDNVPAAFFSFSNPEVYHSQATAPDPPWVVVFAWFVVPGGLHNLITDQHQWVKIGDDKWCYVQAFFNTELKQAQWNHPDFTTSLSSTDNEITGEPTHINSQPTLTNTHGVTHCLGAVPAFVGLLVCGVELG